MFKEDREDAESKRKQQADEAHGDWNQMERNFIANATKEQFCNQDGFPESVKPRRLNCSGKSMETCYKLSHPDRNNNETHRLFVFMEAVLDTLKNKKIDPKQKCP